MRPGDRFTIEPGGVETRARKVEVHGREVPEALAGQRTAVALAGVAQSQVPRGAWVLAPGSLTPSHMLDVKLRVLADAPRELRHRQRVRFHLGASEILGRVSLLQGDRLEPGESAYAQLRLEAQAVAERGDRFVVRSYSPARAIAGGTVILPVAPKRRRSRAAVEELERAETGTAEDKLVAVLEAAPLDVPLAEAAGEAGLSSEEAAGALRILEEAGRVERIDGNRVIAASVLARLRDRAEQLVRETQAANPYRWGMARGELKSRLHRSLGGGLFDRLVGDLTASGQMHRREDQLRVGEPELSLSEEQVSRVTRVAEALEAGEMTPPTVKELEADLGFVPGEMLEYLTFAGRAVKLTPDLYYPAARLEDLKQGVEAFFQSQETLAVGDLRERWGMSRKYSVPVLEYLDKLGWTRRSGDVRIPGRAIEGAEDA
jgi:selenocysteine-specific elongation factor